jgi:hypothetical protein
VGVVPDCIKGTEYDFNLVLHLGHDGDKKWFAEVTKVQGGLGKVFPIGKRFTKFPISEIASYANALGPISPRKEKGEEQIAGEIAGEEGEEHTFANLIAYAEKLGFTKDAVPALLKAHGYSSFTPEKYLELKEVLEKEQPVPTPLAVDLVPAPYGADNPG